jgi:hypothetical protein
MLDFLNKTVYLCLSYTERVSGRIKLSSNGFKCLLVMAITTFYVVFFFFNCIIIPYPAVNNKYIAKHDRKNTCDIHVRPDMPRQKPADGYVTTSTDESTQGAALAEVGGPPDAGFERQVSQEFSSRLDDASSPQGDDMHDIPPLPGYPEEETNPPWPDQAGRDTQPSPASPGNTGRTMPSSTRQNESRVLLSGGSTIKAISSLSFKDKLWLVTILSRCSMEEFLNIMAMLEDGVTYQENLEMYRMLRGKVTDEEQARLDALIKSYTQ